MCDTCELCVQRPAVFCVADEAKLCWACDADVHGANGLVARHIRSLLCQYCGAETECQTSGSHPTPLSRTCAVCNPAYVKENPAHAVKAPAVLERKAVKNNVDGKTDGQFAGKRSREEAGLSQKVGAHACVTISKSTRPEGILGHLKDSHRDTGTVGAVKRSGDVSRMTGVNRMRKDRSKRLKSPVSVMSLSMSSGATTDCDNAIENSDLTDITEESSPPLPARYLKLFG